MENLIITKAIVLRATRFQDSDKILTLLSLEHGKISATLKGCTKQNAKLKFAGLPFCFAEFSLIKRGENFVVVTVSEIESFFELSKDFEKLSLAMAVLEICDKTQPQNQPNENLFLKVLKTLKLMTESQNTKLCLCKFFLDFFENNGYAMSFDFCKVCSKPFVHNIFLNVETGAFVCEDCKTAECMPVQFASFSLMRLLSETELEKVANLKAHNHTIDEVLVLLSANFTGKFEIVLKSLKNL